MKAVDTYTPTAIRYDVITQTLNDRLLGRGEDLAIRMGDEQQSCAEVAARSNQVGHLLRDLGAKPESYIGLCLPQGPETLVAMLGVLKSSGAILALDPEYPTDRWDFIVDQAEIQILVTNSVMLERISDRVENANLTVVLLDEGKAAYTAAQLNEQPTSLPESINQPEQAAYMIYTSGTTGRPKGVVISHRALTASIIDGTPAIGMGEGDRITQFAPLTFDAAVWEHLAPLYAGAEIHCVPREALSSPEGMIGFIASRGITWTYLPPAFFAQWLQYLESDSAGDRLDSLRRIMFAGENLPPELIRRWQKLMGTDVTLMNFYGPTETTVLITGFIIEGQVGDEVNNIPIGKAFGANTAYVLDDELRPCETSEVGTVYLGGPQLATGYFKDPVQTETAFIVRDGERLYNSKDLGFLNEEGEIVFAGRRDNQVKIRGKRIELEEIENSLEAVEGVHQVAVIVTEDKRLVAFYTGRDAGVKEDAARAALKQTLPSFMIPHHIVNLDEMPINNNGKIDKKKLAAWFARSGNDSAITFRAETEMEVIVGKVWHQVLGSTAFTRDDKFFDVGGDSLLMFRALLSLKEEGYVPGEVANLFADNRLSQWALELRPIGENDNERVVPEYYELGGMQEDMFIITEAHPDTQLYHIQFIFKAEDFDTDLMGQAALAHMANHPIFRTTFHVIDGKRMQKVHEMDSFDNFPVEIVDFRGAENEEAAMRSWMNENHKIEFDTSRLPLFRIAKLVHTDATYFGFTFFHQIIDGWTFSQTIYQLSENYKRLAAGEKPESLDIQGHFFDYIQRARRLRETEVYTKERAYWENELRRPFPVLQVQPDHPESTKLRRSAFYHTTPSAVKDGLDRLAREYDTTLHKIMLAVYFQLFHELTGEDSMILGNTTMSRPLELTDIDQVLGCFINILPIRVDQASLPFDQLLQIVSDKMDGAYAHHQIPNESLVQDILAEEKNAGMSWRNIFALDNFPEDHQGDLVQWPPYSWNAIEPYDIALSVIDMHGVFYLYWNYRIDLFDEATIDRIGNRYIALLEQVIEEA